MSRQSESPFAEIEPDFWVAPQLTVADVETAKRFGVTMIVNNRPDGEEPGQPRAEVIAAAAAEQGLGYAEIPVGRTGVTARHLDDFDAAVSGGGKVLAFCRSGMRSTLVWAAAQARAGEPVDTLIEKAAAAGYDISGQRGLLLAAQED